MYQVFEVASGQSITDIYGNAMTSTSLPSGNNLADNSALVVDAAPPTSTITVAYNVTTGVLTFTGSNFDGIGAASASTDIKVIWIGRFPGISMAIMKRPRM